MTLKLGSLVRRALLKVLPASTQASLILKRIARTSPSDIEVVVANTPQLLHEAARLTFEMYRAKRLVDGRGVPVRVTPYLLLPSTIIFVALRRGEVVGTMALLPDSVLGLPMESSFPHEVEALRSQGRRIAEVGALAVKPGERGQGVPLLIYKAMWITAVQLLGIQDLVIAVHPDAEPMYRVPMLFERLTQKVSAYSGLKASALAVALRLNLETFADGLRRVFARDRANQFNPRVYFLEQTHPQLRLPESREALEQLRSVHTRSALRLATLRPEILLGLDDRAFESLRDAMGLATTTAAESRARA